MMIPYPTRKYYYFYYAPLSRDEKYVSTYLRINL